MSCSLKYFSKERLLQLRRVSINCAQLLYSLARFCSRAASAVRLLHQRVHLSIVIMADVRCNQERVPGDSSLLLDWEHSSAFKGICTICIIATNTITITMYYAFMEQERRIPTWKEPDCRDASQLSLHPLQPHLRGQDPQKICNFFIGNVYILHR